jgi:polyhydroxybutyrate depolymerase
MKRLRRMLHLFAAFIPVVALFAPSAAVASTEVTVRVAGTKRTYLLHVPKQLAKPAPIVIALHGGGSNAETMERYSRLSDTADAKGFLAVYPEGIGRVPGIHAWNAGSCCAWAQRSGSDDVAFLNAVIDDVVARHGGDSSRVLVTGISNGAMMAYRFAARSPKRVAAVAAVAGSLEIDASEILGPVPVIHFHGTKDEHVPIKGGRGPKSIVTIPFRSLDDTVSAWVRANKASPIPKLVPIPDLADDGMGTMRQEYAAPRTKAPVFVYLIDGGGHTWPGSSRAERLLGPSTMDFDANEVMWEFLVRVTK